MLKAIIFDFDGIIADTEPIHLEAFRIVLKEINIELSDQDYYKKYLAYDDKTLFKKILEDNRKEPAISIINNLIDKKHILITDLFTSHVSLFPGFEDFVKLINNRYVLSIASGALKAEIEFILSKYNLLRFFQSIIAADEVINCKPHPEPFLKALAKINGRREDKINPSECLVFEDSNYGVEAAKAAKMKCVGITNSYDSNTLKNTDLLVDSFKELNIDIIESLFITD